MPTQTRDCWIPAPKRLTGNLLHARQLSTTRRAAQTKARVGSRRGGRYVNATGHTRAMDWVQCQPLGQDAGIVDGRMRRLF